MKVLVLRAEPSASRTRERLALLGHEAVVAPLFEIVAVRGGIVPLLRSSRPYGTVIAGSANAFVMLAPEGRAQLSGLPALVVGARTAEMAKGLGVLLAAPPYHTAQELAAALEEQVLLEPILYLAGHDRTLDIETALRGARRDFDLVEVYDARAAPALPETAQAALRCGEIDAVLHYSRRSADVYVELASSAALLPEALAPRQLCLAAAIAKRLESAGAPRLRVARLPEESELLSLLEAGPDDESGIAREAIR
jgi:uroporphyrinogen-III synthase